MCIWWWKIKHDQYRGRDCIKKLCEDLKKHEIEMINNRKKKKKMKPLPEENQSYLNETNICIYEE